MRDRMLARGRFHSLARGFLPVAAATAALLAVAACSGGPREAASVQSARAAFVSGARDLGLEVGEDGPAPSAVAEKGDVEKVSEALAGGGHRGATHMPSPDDWRIITTSLALFRHPPYVTDLVLGLGSSVLVALVLTSTPRRASRYDPVAAAEQRKATVICALIGCIAAELVQASEQFLLGAEIALVLFGIGGLVRFRTIFDDPGQTGVAIVATVLGLACGCSEYSLAALALVVVFLVNWWLNSTAIVQVRVRARKHADLAQVQAATTAVLQDQGFGVLHTAQDPGERTFEAYARTASAFDLTVLSAAIQGAVPGARVRIKAS
jgi:hypothetical protein